MAVRILFIDADAPWLVKKKGLSGMEQIIPPVGLMYIATYAKKMLGSRIAVKVVKRTVDCRSRTSLARLVRQYRPHIAGIRGMNIYKRAFDETADTVKGIDPRIITVAGGPYVTMDLENASKNRNIDYFVVGEGEVTFVKLIERLCAGKGIGGVRGVAYRTRTALRVNRPRGFNPNVSALPFPDYRLISVDRYSRFISYGYNRRRQAVIFSSRGCPYRCIYCHSIFGKHFRPRSAQNVFEEIRSLHDALRIRDFYFLDDNFNLDYGRAMEIFDRIIESGLKVNLYLTNGIRGDIIDERFIDRMVEAGVIWVTFSLETSSPRLQRLIRKFIDIRRLARNINYACSKGIMVNCCIMVGFPTETKAEALATVDFLKQFTALSIPMFFSVKYYPHTEIYDLAVRHSIPLKDISDAYAETYHDISHSGTPLISKDDFAGIYYKFLSEVFLSRQRIENALAIQKKYMSEREIRDMYGIFFQQRIRSLQDDVVRYAK